MVIQRKVLVTGCAGFIGSHTAEALLARGDHVIGVDNLNDFYDPRVKHRNLEGLRRVAALHHSSFTFHRADVADREAMAAIFAESGGAINIVCHLAARAGVRNSIEAPEAYIESNIQGTVVLLDLSRQHGVENFVYASSSSVYGANTKVPFAESDVTESPVSPYAATKKACELLASTYHSLYKLPVTGLRFFTVYGPRGRPDMAPFLFVDRISRGIPIKRFGDGTSARDYTYIDDIVEGILAALDRPSPCEVINLGNSRVVALNELISVVEGCLGKKAIIEETSNQPGDVPLTYADVSKARELLGYSPKFGIQQGMEIFVDWYLNQQAQWESSSKVMNEKR